VANVDMAKKFVDVGHESRGFHKIGERCSHGFESQPQIFSDLPDLPSHVARTNDITGLIARKLAGNEDERLRFGHHNVCVENAPLKRPLK
jgi:hypothetical protein